MSPARLLRLWSLIASVRNRVLNPIASMLCGTRMSVDWRDLKIVHPEGIKIGNNFSSGRSLWMESVKGKGRLVIGDNVNASDWVHLACSNRLEIGDGTLIGSKVIITDHSHGVIDAAGIGQSDLRPDHRSIASKGPVLIGRSVWLGDNVCVMPDVTIGDGAVIGASSVVTRSVPAGTVWAGIPARQVWPATEPEPSLANGRGPRQ